MRTSFIVGAALVVLIVAGLVMLSMRSNTITTETDVTSEEYSEQVSDESGQFFQAVPESSEGPSSSPTSDTSTTQSLISETITMSETGFLPASLTIAAGTTVTFLNNGQAAHWPASDVHPTHNILSGFDAKRGLNTGETYSYTFDQAGTWRCHDHLMPQFTCTIIVK
jgi:plastocyanin